MSDGMFRTVSRLKHGYDPDEVDDFFAHARAVYEQGPAAGADQQGRPRRRVRHGARRVRHRGGRRGARPARGRVRRPRPRGVRRAARPAGVDGPPREQARTLYGRLGRPTATGSRPPSGRQPGYEPADVDDLCHRLVAYFDHGHAAVAPPRSGPRRSAAARAATRYAEGPVDAFLSPRGRGAARRRVTLIRHDAVLGPPTVHDDATVRAQRSVVLLGSTGSIGTQAIDVSPATRTGSASRGSARAAATSTLLAAAGRGARRATVAVADPAPPSRPLRGRPGGRPPASRSSSARTASTELAGRGADVVLNGVTGSVGLGSDARRAAGGQHARAGQQGVARRRRPRWCNAARQRPDQIVPVDSEHSAHRAGAARRHAPPRSGG